ncbi:unnamed protein product [Heligmosomoides polygyrus]|uniref:Small integral membrane protein 24 n=1 Tax=Heligmosomoides polygyrus TaxID=6339 RepID=A0A183FC15_HELPZ|nr:unnamed protein product [Heligmosomoides polygyrus]
MWEQLTSFASAPVEHFIPICLLFVILFIFLIVCFFDCWRAKHKEDISVPPRTPTNTVLADSETGKGKDLFAPD